MDAATKKTKVKFYLPYSVKSKCPNTITWAVLILWMGCISPTTVMLYAPIISVSSPFIKHTYSPPLAAVTGDIERYNPFLFTLVEPDGCALMSSPVLKRRFMCKNILCKKKTCKGNEISGGKYKNIIKPLNFQVMVAPERTVWNMRHGSSREDPGTTWRCVHEESCTEIKRN